MRVEADRSGIPPFERSRATWALYALLAFFAYVETALGPAMPFVRSHLGLGYTVASLHFAAFAIGSMAVGFIARDVFVRFGRTNALWGGLIGMTIGISLVAVSPTAIGTIAGALAMGLFGAVGLVAIQAILADLHSDHRTIAMTESNVVASGCAIMAPLSIGASDAIGLTWRGGLLVAVPILALLLFFFGQLPFPTSQSSGRHTTTPAGLPRAFWLLWGVMFLAASIEWSVGYWGADFLSSVVGLRERSAAAAMSVYLVAMVAGRFTGSRLVRRFSTPHLLIAALVIALVSFPVLLLGQTPIVCLVGLFFVGIGVANLYPLVLGAATEVAGRRAEEATARIAISASGALLVTPFIVGAVSDALGMKRGFSLVFILISAALFLMAVTFRAVSASILASATTNEGAAA